MKITIKQKGKLWTIGSLVAFSILMLGVIASSGCVDLKSDNDKIKELCESKSGIFTPTNCKFISNDQLKETCYFVKLDNKFYFNEFCKFGRE